MINMFSLATTYGGGRSLLALPIKLTPQCKLLWRPSSPFSLDGSRVTLAAHGAHSKYTSSLKDYHWVSRHLNRIHYLLGYRHNRSLNYAHLRSVINELLQLCTHATNARPYHAALAFDAATALPQIATMLKLTFSEATNRSHESIDEEGRRTYEFIEFPAYFRICNSWNAAVDSEVLAFYLHSYMNLLFDRHFLNFVTVFDVLREGEPTDTSTEIINRSVQGIVQIM